MNQHNPSKWVSFRSASTDPDGKQHKIPVKLASFEGGAIEVWKILASHGITIKSNKVYSLLATYLKNYPTLVRYRSVDKTGWHAGVFVLSDSVIGNAKEKVIFQNEQFVEPGLSVSGSTEEWRDNVANLAKGNTVPIFAISMAFAASLVDVAGENSGGFHLRGGSSTGKTTILHLGASVYGDPQKYIRQWRSTANGLEGLAAMHNDLPLFLDELGQLDPEQVGEAAYLLANGQGKNRAGMNGQAISNYRWRLLYLSSGEESLSAMMERAGKKAKAGQEIRLAEIPIGAGVGIEAFTDIHDVPTKAKFALALKDASNKYYGAVGLEWIKHIVDDRIDLVDTITEGIQEFLEKNLPEKSGGQVIRVARRFALVGIAGELATHYGLTGWNEGEAMEAAGKSFKAWVTGFGTPTNRELIQVLEQTKRFFEENGHALFQNIDAADIRIPNRAGFYEMQDGYRIYIMQGAAIKKHICGDLDFKFVLRTLAHNGWIRKGSEKRNSVHRYLPGSGKTRCVVFTDKMYSFDLF